MSYQIIPNVVFIVSILGILLIILRHLPEAANISSKQALEKHVEEKLLLKGLPVVAISTLKAWFKLWTKKIWNFVLEAKDLKPTAVAGYKIRRMFRQKPKPVVGDITVDKSLFQKDEKYFLEKIKQEPKSLANYDALGKYYIEGKNYQDALDIYIYLTSHEPGNADYNARMGSCYFHTQLFGKASEYYKKSTDLDSTQPNRYYNLGLSLHADQKYLDASKAFQKAIALEPENSKYYISLSNTFLKLNDIIKAKETLLQAERINPENENIKAKLQALPEEERVM